MLSRLSTAFGFALVLVVSLELVLWEAFLTEARPFGVALPVSAALAVVGNLALGTAGARVVRSVAGAVVPGVVWLVVALSFGTETAAGDRVVLETWRGVTFLLAGAAAAAVAVGWSGVPSGTAKAGATPGRQTRR